MHIKSLFIFLTVATAIFSSITCKAQYQTFTFKMNELSAIVGKSIGNSNKKVASIEVNVADDGQVVIGDGEGMYLLGEFRGKWIINDFGAIEIKDSKGDLFLVDKEKKVLNLKRDETIMIFSKPTSVKDFDNAYYKLHAYLSGHNLLTDRKKASSSSPSTGNGPVTPPSSLKGVQLQLYKMCGKPFGYQPIKGRSYEIEDINRAAKSVWGWDLQLDHKLHRAGYTWPKLDGMTFLGYPIYQIHAYGSDGKYFLSDFYCEIIISNTSTARKKAEAAVSAYFKSRGWTPYDDGRPSGISFYKGNVIVSCYSSESKQFPGKLEFTINAQSFPTPADVIERVEGGLG